MQCTLSNQRRLRQKILPPNFRAAGFPRHLARDSACGENSLAHCKKPQRFRIRQSAAVRVNSTKVQHQRTTEPDDRASLCQMANPAAAFPSCGKPGMHLCAAGKYDARTVTLLRPRHSLYSCDFVSLGFASQKSSQFSNRAAEDRTGHSNRVKIDKIRNIGNSRVAAFHPSARPDGLRRLCFRHTYAAVHRLVVCWSMTYNYKL